MIKEIKYVFNSAVNYYTCHALFSRITDGYLSKMETNSHSKQPEYKISFLDRVITILINSNDFPNIIKPDVVSFNNEGKTLMGNFFSENDFLPTYNFQENEFVFASGIISYAKNLNTKEPGRKHSSPINPKGEIVFGEKHHTLTYLENKLGIELLSQANDRNFRFEMLSYKHFQGRNEVYSKTNNNKLSIHNVFSFELQGYVKKPKISNSLEFSSIGKRRSYGFGNVYLKS